MYELFIEYFAFEYVKKERLHLYYVQKDTLSQQQIGRRYHEKIESSSFVQEHPQRTTCL